MVRSILTAGLLLQSALLPRLGAQESPAELSRAVVGVVDVDRVSSESLFGQAFNDELTQLQTMLEADLGERRVRVEADQAAFQEAVEAFQAEREQMIETDIEARETLLTEQQQALQELFSAAQVDAEAAQRRLQNETTRLLTELNQEIRPHVSAVVEELGIDILLPTSQTVLSSPEFEITDRVIERADSAFSAAPGSGL